MPFLNSSKNVIFNLSSEQSKIKFLSTAHPSKALRRVVFTGEPICFLREVSEKHSVDSGTKCHLLSATRAPREGQETSSEGAGEAAGREMRRPQSTRRPKGSGKPRLAPVGNGLLLPWG